MEDGVKDDAMASLLLQSLRQRADAFTEAQRDLNQQIASEYKTLVEGVSATLLSIYPGLKSIMIKGNEEDDWGIELDLSYYIKDPSVTGAESAWRPVDDLLDGRWFCPYKFGDPWSDYFLPDLLHEVTEIISAAQHLVETVHQNYNLHQYTYGVVTLVFDRHGTSRA